MTLSRKELEKAAIAHAERNPRKTWSASASARRPSRATLDRWCVNYLRHRETDYDVARDGLDRYSAHDLRIAAYERIAAAYPHLAYECSLQLESRVQTG